jgi:hypothetical protein
VGTFHDYQNDTVCVVCPAGRYADERGAKSCEKCPLGRSNGHSTTEIFGLYSGDVANSTVYHDDLSDCKHCPVGTYATINSTGTLHHLGYGVPSGATMCLVCPAGSYQNGTNGTAHYNCTSCVAGKYLSDDANLTRYHDSESDCTVCAKGYFSEFPRAQLCNGTCHSGKYSNGTLASEHDEESDCLDCSNTTYSPPASSKCYSECPAGTFVSLDAGATAGECTYCLPGTSATNKAGDVAIACTVCMEGKIQTEYGQTTCEYCPAGTINSDDRQIYRTDHDEVSDCADCPDGKYASTDFIECISCPAGTKADDDTQSCLDCPIGYYGDGGGCVLCGGGFYTTGWYKNTTENTDGTTKHKYGTGATGCSGCDAGDYSKGRNLSCSFCEVGRYSTAASSACLDCQPGTYAEFTQTQNFCPSCDYGRFSNTTGATTCRECPRGSYQGARSQDVCNLCPAGKYGDAQGLDECTNCLSGSYSASDGAKECVSCPKGRYVNFDQSTSCFDCGTGTYSNKTGSTSCTECLEGYFQSETGQTACGACAPGTYIGLTQSSYCANCTAGRFSSIEASSACSNCQAGTFSTESDTACTTCPDGYYSSTSVATECEVCESGKYMAADRTACLSCRDLEDGLMSDAGSTTCRYCDTEYYKSSRYCEYKIGNRWVSASNYSRYSESPDETIDNCQCELCSDIANGNGFECATDTYPTTPGGQAVGARNISNLVIEKDYWRYPSWSVYVHKCNVVRPASCPGGTFSDEQIRIRNVDEPLSRGVCAEGYGGPLCQICEVGFWYDTMTKTCGDCSDSGTIAESAPTIAFAVIITLFVAFITFRIYSAYKKSQDQGWAQKLKWAYDKAYTVIERCEFSPTRSLFSFYSSFY